MKGLQRVSFWLLAILLLSALAKCQEEWAEGEQNEEHGGAGAGSPAQYGEQSEGDEQNEEAADSYETAGGGEEEEASDYGADQSDSFDDAQGQGYRSSAKGGAHGESYENENESGYGGAHDASYGSAAHGGAHGTASHSDYGDEGHQEEHYQEHEEEPLEEHHEEHEEDYEEEHDQDEHHHVEFQDYSETEHMHSYKKIAADMKIYEDEYSACIREIKDADYTEEAIDECLGKNFIKVTLDLKYIILKVMSKADTKVRQIFIEDCYSAAGIDEKFSTACDLMERDILDMLWNGLDFLGLVDLNKMKYLEEWGEMPEQNYNAIYNELSKLSHEFFELLDELDSHKEITILRIKTLIDDRTKLILEEAQNHPDNIEPATVRHRIEITETVDNDDGSGLEFMPATQFHDGGYLKRKERRTAQVNRDGEKHNSLRTLNSGGRYNELNGSNRGIGITTRDRYQRNEKFKQMMWDRLGSTARAQARTPFKNIHTAHYSRIGK